MMPDYVKKENWSDVRVKSSFHETRFYDIIVGRINNSPQEFELRVSRITAGKPKIRLSVINYGNEGGRVSHVKLFEKAAYKKSGTYSECGLDFMDSQESEAALSLVDFYVDKANKEHLSTIDNIRREGLRVAGLSNDV